MEKRKQYKVVVLYLALFLLLILNVGCASIFPQKTKYRFPDDIRSLCYGELNAAKECIESTGTRLKAVAPELRVVKVDGERRFSEGWAWRAPSLNNIWVLGLTTEYSNGRFVIQIAVNPTTKGDISVSTLRHEMGHFWIMSNHKDYTHNPRYRMCFDRWVDHGVRAMLFENPEGGISIIHYIVSDED